MLGRTDGREIIGIPADRVDAVVAHVREATRDHIKPPLDFVVERMELPDAVGPGRRVVRVEVDSGALAHRSPGGYLRRVGDEKREILPEALHRLFQQRSRTGIVPFDDTDPWHGINDSRASASGPPQPPERIGLAPLTRRTRRGVPVEPSTA